MVNCPLRAIRVSHDYGQGHEVVGFIILTRSYKLVALGLGQSKPLDGYLIMVPLLTPGEIVEIDPDNDPVAWMLAAPPYFNRIWYTLLEHIDPEEVTECLPPLRASGSENEGSHMTQRFVDDDQTYRQWVENHPGGYVLNTHRVADVGYLRLHSADCSHITRFVGANPTSTDFGKICGLTVGELQRWALDETGGDVRACRVCDPLDQRAATRPE